MADPLPVILLNCSAFLPLHSLLRWDCANRGLPHSLTHDFVTWYMTQDAGHLKHDAWPLHMTHDTWKMGKGPWHRVHNIGNVTKDTWHFINVILCMTYDIWYTYCFGEMRQCKTKKYFSHMVHDTYFIQNECIMMIHATYYMPHDACYLFHDLWSICAQDSWHMIHAISLTPLVKCDCANLSATSLTTIWQIRKFKNR